jgi:sec-independent protein translocase protein TatC
MVAAELTPRLEMLQRHLRGVKKRLLSVFISFGVGASLTWYFHREVLMVLLVPARGNLSSTGLPIFTGPTEMFSLSINMALWGGVVFAVPVLAYHIARLINPLLTPLMRRFIAIFLPTAGVLFLCGAAFAYFVLLPTGLSFLLQFGTGVTTPMIRVREYIALTLSLALWLGVIFELPLAMFLLSKLGIVPFQWFRRFQRYIPVAAFILGAIITPTFDVVNQTLVAVPIILLFEVGLLLAWLARPKQLQRNSTV